MAKIMVVEDEGVVAADIQVQLQSLGYKVCSLVTTGEDAVNNLEMERPDLVLMDISLAGVIDGIEAAAQIKMGFNIPVVYLTAYANNEIMNRAKLTEPYGYLSSPSTPRNCRPPSRWLCTRPGWRGKDRRFWRKRTNWSKNWKQPWKTSGPCRD